MNFHINPAVRDNALEALSRIRVLDPVLTFEGGNGSRVIDSVFLSLAKQFQQPTTVIERSIANRVHGGVALLERFTATQSHAHADVERALTGLRELRDTMTKVKRPVIPISQNYIG